MPEDSPRRFKNSRPLKKLSIFFSGMRQALQRERSVAIQLSLGVLGLIICFWLRDWFDFILILVVTGFMIVAELFNTTIEWICDFIQPANDPRIAAIKDASSAATGIAVLVWVVTLAYEGLRILGWV
jgi:diacylglycerol kinase (ATP)